MVIAGWLVASVALASPFVDDLAPQYTPDGVAAVLADVAATCDLDEVDLQSLDCSGYPCIAWFETEGSLTDLETCPAWKAAYRRRPKTEAKGVLMGEDETLRAYAGIGVWAQRAAQVPDEAVNEALDRLTTGRAALMTAWNARELTDDEIAAYWASAAASGDEAAAEWVRRMGPATP